MASSAALFEFLDLFKIRAKVVAGTANPYLNSSAANSSAGKLAVLQHQALTEFSIKLTCHINVSALPLCGIAHSHDGILGQQRSVLPVEQEHIKERQHQWRGSMTMEDEE
jgi:hypothetical protein